MWGRRLGVRKLNARAPPVLIGYEKETFFGINTARTLMVMERTNNLEGLYLFFFSFFSFLSNIPHRKSFFFSFGATGGREGPTYFSSLSRGAVVTYPTLPRHFESQKKAGWSLDNQLVAFFFFFFLSFSFMSDLSNLLHLFGGMVATKGSENSKKNCV